MKECSGCYVVASNESVKDHEYCFKSQCQFYYAAMDACMYGEDDEADKKFIPKCVNQK